MGPECAYSFKDLYIAAFKKAPEAGELESLYALAQDQRNKQVKEWAILAGWGTKERIGSDGVQYTAFCPLWGTHVSSEMVIRGECS